MKTRKYKSHISAFIFTFLISQISFAGIVVLNGLTQEHNLHTTGVDAGKIIVKNTGSKPERVIVYLNDMVQNCSSSVDFISAGESSQSCADWVVLETTDIVLEPHQEYAIRYQINKPDDIANAGSYWTAIMVEGATPIDTSQVEKGFEVNTKVRYAVQVIVNVGSYSPGKVIFKDVSLSKSETGNLGMVVLLENRGIFLLKPVVSLELYNENGDLVHEVQIPFKKLYPNSCKAFELPLSNIEKERYTAVLVADCGNEDVFGININLDLSE